MTSAWPQSYYLFGRGLGFSALLAVLPTLLLLFLLAVKRKASWIAALAGLAATIVLATGAYGMSWNHTISAAAYGAAFGLFPITWVIYWALVLCLPLMASLAVLSVLQHPPSATPAG